MMKAWPVIFLSVPLAVCSGQTTSIGDTADGSRATPIHLIKVYDEFDHPIRPDDTPVMPYSPKQTCRKCHDYERVARGWHFNWADSGVVAGREGEPWIFVDRSAGVQVPLSTRGWRGTFLPSAFGMRTLKFLSTFGRHMPGGGAGEKDSLQDAADFMRWQVSGNLEVNCQSCHNADPAQNPAEYGVQVLRQNFRWAPAASSGFATVKGSASDMPDNFDLYSAVPPERSGTISPTVTYNASRFDPSGRVLFSVPRHVPPSQCYFCHSSKVIDPGRPERWDGDEDVHIAAGMTCVDCHRNGLDHFMVRGYEGEAAATGSSPAASLTCRGCHLGAAETRLPGEMRRRAPRPEHRGIPPVHFEKLTCTMCHSGPWPADSTRRVKTSRAHALGIPKTDRADDALPHVMTPLFVKGPDGVYGPRNAVWPAFWAYEQADSLFPIQPSSVSPFIAELYLKDSTRTVGRWPRLREADLLVILGGLQDSTRGTAVYVAGGTMFYLNEKGGLATRDHDAAHAYTWPVAHDVRPKGQSLGIKGCDDCHFTGSPVYFGRVRVGSPFVEVRDSVLAMTDFQDRSPVFPWLFSMSFLFRPLLKFVIILSFLTIAATLLFYLLRGLGVIIRTLTPEGE